MTEQAEGRVRVFCPKCKGGNNAIWEGSLLAWGLELAKNKAPAWFLYAQNHERVHGHTVMVQYPSRTVPLDLRKMR